MDKLSNRKINNLKGSEAIKSMVVVGYDKRKAMKLLLKTLKEVKSFNIIHPKRATLENMFTWDSTKQGHTFWSDIFYKRV